MRGIERAVIVNVRTVKPTILCLCAAPAQLDVAPEANDSDMAASLCQLCAGPAPPSHKQRTQTRKAASSVEALRF